MTGNERRRAIEPCWIDKAAFALWRPWTLGLAFAFLLTPGAWLLAGIDTGAAFLKIGTGAKPAALGGAYTAAARDVDALHYNPAGLAQLERRELGATHAEWLLGSKFDFVGYAQPLRRGALGVGVTRLASGNQEGRGADRRSAGGFDASDTAYAVGYSRRLEAAPGGGRASVGGSVKLLRSQIGPYSAQTVAFDLGAQERLAGLPLSLGVAVLNLGRGMRFLEQRDPLPLTASMGAGWRLGGALSLALDVRRDVYDRRTDVAVGTEYALLPSFSVRLGYGSQAMSAARGAGGTLGALGGMGAGFGVSGERYRADYTFTPFGDLGDVQRVSLGARW